MTDPTLTAVILTLNESRHIQDCVKSLAWTDRVLVLDSYSQDDTQELASAAGADIMVHRFENYAQQRNLALSAVTSEWVLFVDADERVTPELAGEVRATIASCVENGWWVPRHNYILGHRMCATGWYPDYQLRLLRRAAAHYDDDRHVHEVVQLEGKSGHLACPLIHYNYETLRQFLDKQRRYLDYDVGILLAEGIKPCLHTPYTQGLRHFWWRFVTLRGWRDTVWGALLSALMAYYEVVKYVRVRRALRRGTERRGD